MPYTPIIGTLIYVQDPETGAVLLVHRIARRHDEQLGKWNGLGGKVERNEDIATSARRELMEEANLESLDLTLRGTISWPGFGPKGEDWLGFVFLTRQVTGVVPDENEEGPLVWVAHDRVLQACDSDPDVRAQSGLVFWDGDRLFLPLVFDHDVRQFHGYMPYENGLPTAWSVERL
jgi:8-oxo-dGTP diphosphatase